MTCTLKPKSLQIIYDDIDRLFIVEIDAKFHLLNQKMTSDCSFDYTLVQSKIVLRFNDFITHQSRFKKKVQ